jgi:hypothetical protein
MSRSEIFDSFVKIAQEKGMISNDSSAAKKKLEQTGRADSLDISAIEALYGVKPDSPKSMDYKSNIMEAAHPNSVVVSPSYDKLNGLVENNIERQNIILHIMQKTPDGLLTQRKYAEQELIMSLVRIANDLDNHDQEELRSLADTCLLQASQKKKLTKTAQDPITLSIIAIALTLGAIYAKNHLAFHSDGFKLDFQKLIAEIDDLLEANTSTQTSLGAGYEYTPAFLKTVADLKSKVTAFAGTVGKVMPLLEKLQQPRDGKELKELAEKPETQEILAAYKTFRSEYENLLPYIEQVQQNFSNEGYKTQAISHKGWMSSLVDATEILHGGKGLVADDFDDVRHALETFMKDAVDIAKSLSSADSLEKAAKERLQQANAKAQSELGSGQPSPAQKVDEHAKDNKSLSDYFSGLHIPGMG